MISSEEEDPILRKQENINLDNVNASKASSSTTTSSWSRFKDPRIVRVSRALGGKDRHSKVCTVRGLKDRRVRLSVPTAIQLYDLQDRLGFNQPSKVVDWLLNVAKNEIDELPPLQIPQGCFIHPIHDFMASQSSKQPPANFSWNDPSRSSTTFDGKSCKDDHHSWTTSAEERQFNEGGHDYVPTSDFLSRQQNPSTLTTLLNSTTAPFNSFARWDSSSSTLSRPTMSQQEDMNNFSLVQLGSHHQLSVYHQPAGINGQPYFTSQNSPTNTTFDLRPLSFHSTGLSNSSSQTVRPFHLTADLLPSQNNGVDGQNKHA